MKLTKTAVFVTVVLLLSAISFAKEANMEEFFKFEQASALPAGISDVRAVEIDGKVFAFGKGAAANTKVYQLGKESGEWESFTDLDISLDGTGIA